MRFVFLVVIAVILVGCRPNKDTHYVAKPSSFSVEVGTITTDYAGRKYRLVSPMKDLGNGTFQADLWERIEPPETNHWFTPTLGSVMDTNSPPIFNSLTR